MEDLVTQLQHHAESSLGYWAMIRLTRMALKVNKLEKTQQRIIAHLNKTYED